MFEQDLIARARQGNGAAWETLVRAHQEPVFRLAYLVLGNVQDAEDVAQETFLRAFQALDSFHTQRALRPWLLRITTNLAHNRRRALSRYLAALRRMVRRASDATNTDAEAVEWNADQHSAHALWQATRQLPRADQEVIYLRYFINLSVDDTATVLEIAPGTVKSRLHRALQRLREVVEREFPDLREEYEDEPTVS